MSESLTAIALILVVVARASAQIPECPDTRALAAERGLDNLKTWTNLYAAFREYQACDDGAIAEGWDDFVARMLARKWSTVVELQRLASRDRDFEGFVISHITETADDDDLRQALRNARDHCPRNARPLCAQIVAAARDALPNR
jgi:hypothetical protein